MTADYMAPEHCKSVAREARKELTVLRLAPYGSIHLPAKCDKQAAVKLLNTRMFKIP